MSARFKQSDNADFAALADVSLEISEERDKTERKAIELLKQGKDAEALRILRKHWGITPRLKIVK